MFWLNVSISIATSPQGSLAKFARILGFIYNPGIYLDLYCTQKLPIPKIFCFTGVSRCFLYLNHTMNEVQGEPMALCTLGSHSSVC